MLHQEPIVAAVCGQPDRQQLVVFPPEPRYLYAMRRREENKFKKQHGKRMRDICLASGAVGGFRLVMRRFWRVGGAVMAGLAVQAANCGKFRP